MRPNSDEYAPYYGQYISKVPDDGVDVVHHLMDQHHETVEALRKAKSKGDYAYAEGKWTVKDVIEHICDAERVFAYRALRIGRGDKTPLPGFEQDDYVKAAQAGRRTMDDLLDELWSVRAATLSLAKHLPKDALTLKGTASGNPISVRALLYIIAGHERHHLALLKERYGV